MSNSRQISRRSLLQGAAAAIPLLSGTGVVSAALAEEEKPAPVGRKIKLGVVGNGERGSWITGLFQKHGGYEIHAVADYFQEVTDACGDLWGVEKSRRFSGLSGYKKVIDSGIEAIVIITPPHFIHGIAEAAAEAGLHIYMAKPVAIDAPGCASIGESSKHSTKNNRVFFVDYQMPTDPNNQLVYQAVREGKAGKLARMRTVGISGGRNDPPRTANIESRLRNLVWDNDIGIGGGMIISYDIHAIDAAIWLTGQRPIAAMGCSRIVRPNPNSDGCDVSSVVFEYADGLIHEHFSQHLPNHTQSELSCKIYSHNSRAFVDYWEEAMFQIRGVKPIGGPVTELYDEGAKRNIATFYQLIEKKNYENAITQRAIDGALTAILGREAAARHGRMTMEELLKENRKVPLDLTGLKE
jgi:predicted dehydrogenase